MEHNEFLKQVMARSAPDIVRGIKIHAKKAARAAGTSLQSELNKFAQGRGHTHWGAYTAMLASRPRINHEDVLIAVDSAKRKGWHVVVRAETRQASDQRLRDIAEALMARAASDPAHFGQRVFTVDAGGVIHVHGLGRFSILGRPENDGVLRKGDTLVVADGTGKGNAYSTGAVEATVVTTAPPHPDDQDIGEYVVASLNWPINQMNRIMSSEDRRVFYSTTSVKYILPQNDDATIKAIQGQVGATTIKRTTLSKSRRKGDDGGMR